MKETVKKIMNEDTSAIADIKLSIMEKLNVEYKLKEIDEAIYNGKCKVDGKIITKPVSAKDENEAKEKFIKSIEVQMKNGHITQGEITNVTISK